MQTTELQKVASQVRRDILRQVHGCQSGHPGGSLGCTDLLVELYFNSMNLKSDSNLFYVESHRLNLVQI